MSADTPNGDRLRPRVQLVHPTLSLVGRYKLEFFLLALPVLVSDVGSLSLIVNGTDMVLAEQFSGVWDRISEVRNRDRAGDPSRLHEYWNEVESTQWDIANWGLSLLAAGLIIHLATTFIHVSAVSRICVLSPEGTHRNVVGNVVDALRWGVSRVPRLSALFAKICAAGIAVVIAIAVCIALGIATSHDIVPVSVALFAAAGLSVFAITVVLGLVPGILVVAFIASAVGLKQSPVRYALRLVRGRFWATLGNTYLIVLVAILLGISSELVISAVAPDRWYGRYLIGSVIELASFTVCTVGSCMLYRDLGGELA